MRDLYDRRLIPGLAAALGLALALHLGRRPALLAVGASAAIALVLLPAWKPERMTSGLFRFRSPMPRSLDGPDGMLRDTVSIVFHEDDPTTTVTVKDLRPPGQAPSRAVFTNGKSDGSVPGDYPTMALAALLPIPDPRGSPFRSHRRKPSPGSPRRLMTASAATVAQFEAASRGRTPPSPVIPASSTRPVDVRSTST